MGRFGMLAAAAAMVGAIAYEPPRRRSKFDEENPALPDNPDPRVKWPDPKARTEELRAKKAKLAPVLRTSLRCGPMTDEQIRASAAQMKACKPQRPNRSRKSKAKKKSK